MCVFPPHLTQGNVCLTSTPPLFQTELSCHSLLLNCVTHDNTQPPRCDCRGLPSPSTPCLSTDLSGAEWSARRTQLQITSRCLFIRPTGVFYLVPIYRGPGGCSELFSKPPVDLLFVSRQSLRAFRPVLTVTEAEPFNDYAQRNTQYGSRSRISGYFFRGGENKLCFFVDR